MSQIVNILSSLKKSDTPYQDVVSVIEAITDDNQLEVANEVKQAYINVMGNASINSWSYANNGKPVSIMLTALVNELPKLINGEYVTLEKYLIPLDNPFRSFRPNFVINRNLTAKVEMLKVIRNKDIKSMCLFYALFLMHMAS